jgi:thiamine-phosphate pyrophosphorylase
VISLGTPPFICLITKGEATPENYPAERARILEVVREAAADGVSMIQIREKQLPARLLLELVRDAVHVVAGTTTKILVNERADVALAARANGVHLPENSLSSSVIRRNMPKGFLIGASIHSLKAMDRAVAADYVFFAPVFATPGKGEPAGLDELRRVCESVDGIPVIALGGVDENNVKAVLASGAAGIAAIRSLYDGDTRRRIVSLVR